MMFNVIPVQFVNPGETQADSSPIHVSGGTYPYWPNRTVDGNFSQNVRACLVTAVSSVTEAWLRIDLQYVRSIKSVKFYYRNDSEYNIKVHFNGIFLFLVYLVIDQSIRIMCFIP